MDVQSPVSAAFRRGQLLDAISHLKRIASQSADEMLLATELNYLTGFPHKAADDAGRALNNSHLLPRQRARYCGLLASHAHDLGDLDASLNFCREAASLADESKDTGTIAIAYAQLLERSCDRSGLHSSLPLSAQTRRAAARCDDPHVKAAIHAAFGRLEGRAGRLEAACRHFAVARTLLEIEPSLYLGAVIDLDECSVRALGGDTISAIDLAKRGAQCATESGWLKGQTVASVSLAHLFVTTDRLQDAEEQIRKARHHGARFAAYELALADTRAQMALSTGNYSEGEEILRQAEDQDQDASPWYRLMGQHTKIRLLLAQKRFPEALELALKSAIEARRKGDTTASVAFELSAEEARIQMDPHRVKFFNLEIANLLVVDDLPLSATAHKSLLTAKALSESSVRGQIHLDRALRVLDVGLNRPLQLEAQRTAADRRQAPGDAVGAPTATSALDAAVALMELAGHPDILGREAVALLQSTGCVDAVALLAGGHALRIVELAGWTEAEALAAAGAEDAGDPLPLGQHRGETWQLVVRPKADLDHRCTLAAIRKLVATAVLLDRYRRDEKQRAALWPAEALDADPESIWTSEPSAEILSIGRRIAATPLPILLTGETGTGKEMLARAIHRASDRADRPMVPFNCSAVPRDMLESQLFGYRKGAFTGADVSFPGVIRGAAGGTLFLDEIADVSLELQPKLLRFLEHQEVHPLGEPQPIKVDVRIIAATNARLEQLVAQGRFRDDLFYRLNVLHLKLPPLRERREEIPALLQHYIRRYSEEQKRGRLTLSDEALEYLLLYAWPGNIRQLANEVRRLVALAEPDATLTPAMLSSEIQASRRTMPAAAPGVPEIRLPLDQPLPAAVELLEQTMVRRALERTHGRVEDASRLLGISRKGLFLKRRRWGFQQRAS